MAVKVAQIMPQITRYWRKMKVFDEINSEW